MPINYKYWHVFTNTQIKEKGAELPKTIPLYFDTGMAQNEQTNTFKRKRNRYRMVIMNDDTFEEVATLRLTRLSVYVTFSSIFVILTGLTLALISFTNLKYLVPGYGKQSSLQELRTLKMRTDSMEQVMLINQQYFNDLTKVLSGDSSMALVRDTNTLNLPKVENEYQ